MASLEINRCEIERAGPALRADPLDRRVSGARGPRKRTQVKRCGEHVYVLCHGSLSSPYIGYVYPWNREAVRRQVEALLELGLGARRVCLLLGHTHVPFLCHGEGDGHRRVQVTCPQATYGRPVSLGEGIAVTNPGSVGQPRDCDPRAAYAILDTRQHTIVFRRVAYGAGLLNTQRAMGAHEPRYPDRLIRRLRRADPPSHCPPGWQPLLSDPDGSNGDTRS